MYQKDKKSNLLVSALDTFDLGASVNHEKIMDTLSEWDHYQHIPFWKILFQ
jgi:hypothetical protein